LLRGWLESKGHAVLDTGLKRSTLVGNVISEAKKGNILGKTTLSLLYCTDFADQLENKIIPALNAGYIVLADRLYSRLWPGTF
jgi:dTMP kinase